LKQRKHTVDGAGEAHTWSYTVLIS